MHAAHEIHRKATKPPVCLSIGFGPATNYRKRDVPRLAAELADCVPVSFATSQKVETLEHGLARPTGVDCIVGHAPMFYEPPEGRWAVSHGGSVYPSETFLQQAIDAKEKKLANYAATAVNEAWLLIVVPNLRASGFLHEPNPEHVFRSSFRRVIVMWLFGLKIMDLKVVAVGPSH